MPWLLARHSTAITMEYYAVIIFSVLNADERRLVAVLTVELLCNFESVIEFNCDSDTVDVIGIDETMLKSPLSIYV